MQLQAAAQENKWGLDLGNIAMLWRGGCIIRGLSGIRGLLIQIDSNNSQKVITVMNVKQLLICKSNEMIPKTAGNRYLTYD